MRRLLAPMLVLGGVLATAPAAAAPPEPAPAPSRDARPLSETLSGPAKEAYEAARILLNNQDPAGALTKYRGAYDVAKDPRLLFDMAVCERDLRAYAQMQALLVRYEQEAGDSLSPAQKADVDAALAAIRNLVGAVRLSVDQAGASVIVDGNPLGATPLADPIVLDLGKHVIDVKKDGFEPFERAIEVAGGNEMSLPVALVAIPHAAKLLVVSDAGAVILLDRKAMAHGRFDAAVAPGLHELRVTEAGRKPYATSLNLGDGESRGLQVTLEDEPRGPGLWPWIVGGTALVAGAVVVGYFVLRPHDEQAAPPTGTLPTVVISGSPSLR